MFILIQAEAGRRLIGLVDFLAQHCRFAFAGAQRRWRVVVAYRQLAGNDGLHASHDEFDKARYGYVYVLAGGSARFEIR